MSHHIFHVEIELDVTGEDAGETAFYRLREALEAARAHLKTRSDTSDPHYYILSRPEAVQ